jgi:hypothetical protein
MHGAEASEIKPTLLWYLDQRKRDFLWKPETNWTELCRTSDEIWCCRYSEANPIPAERYADFQPPVGGPWLLVDHEQDKSHPDHPDKDPVDYWEVFHWRKVR